MPSKAESNTLRFAVGTPQNPQSWIWRMWVQGDEVYLGARDTLTAFKVSLHKSNIWRIAFVAELEREDKDSNRVIIKWNRPEEFAPGWTTSIGILVSCVQAQRPFTQTTVDDNRVKWFPPPKEGKKLIFKVLFSQPNPEVELKRISAEHDQVAARMVKKSGEVVWLIVRQDDLATIELQKIQDVMTNTRIHLEPGSSEGTLTGSARALLVVSEDIPTASAQPTILDIPLGLENVQTA